MKFKLLSNGWLILAALTIISFGCEKEDEIPQFEEISFDSEAVLDNLPSALKSSTDEYAQQCVDDIESALDMSTFMDDMVPPEYAERTAKKASGDTWSWTVSDGMMSYTFYWTYEEDNLKKYWTMDIQFGDGERYSYITAWESKDGKQGEVMYNFNWISAYDGSSEDDYEDLFWTYSWNIDASGNYKFVWNYDTSDPTYDYLMQYEVVVNSDGSGTIDYLYLDAKYYHMEWDTDGNGSWAYYSDGSEYMSGSWTV